MITDGLPEALSVDGELFGCERLLKVARNNLDKSPDELIERLIEELRYFVDYRPLPDDITIVAAKLE